MANHVAVRLDREGEAEMSCIAGVGGNVPHLVNIARSGRPILALDGCALECTRSSLMQRGISPDHHLLLNEHGVKKRYGADFDPEQAAELLEQARALVRSMRPAALAASTRAKAVPATSDQPAAAKRAAETELSALPPDGA